MVHANIVHYLGFDKHEGRFVMILEYVKGKDLRKLVGPPQSRVDKDEPPPPKKLNPKVDDSLNDLILHGLDKKLDRRFQSKVAAAEAFLDNLLHRYPHKAQVYLTLGEVYSRRIKPAQSETILRRGVSQCPSHPALHLNLAMLLNTHGNKTEAIDALEKAIQLGLGRQGPYAETLLRNWKAGKK